MLVGSAPPELLQRGSWALWCPGAASITMPWYCLLSGLRITASTSLPLLPMCTRPKGQRRLCALTRTLKYTIRMCPSCCFSGRAMCLAPRRAGGQPAWFSSAALGKVHRAGSRPCCGWVSVPGGVLETCRCCTKGQSLVGKWWWQVGSWTGWSCRSFPTLVSLWLYEPTFQAQFQVEKNSVFSWSKNGDDKLHTTVFSCNIIILKALNHRIMESPRLEKILIKALNSQLI